MNHPRCAVWRVLCAGLVVAGLGYLAAVAGCGWQEYLVLSRLLQGEAGSDSVLCVVVLLTVGRLTAVFTTTCLAWTVVFRLGRRFDWERAWRSWDTQSQAQECESCNG